jgi:hypothetical protein
MRSRPRSERRGVRVREAHLLHEPLHLGQHQTRQLRQDIAARPHALDRLHETGRPQARVPSLRIQGQRVTPWSCPSMRNGPTRATVFLQSRSRTHLSTRRNTCERFLATRWTVYRPFSGQGGSRRSRRARDIDHIARAAGPATGRRSRFHGPPGRPSHRQLHVGG